MTRASAERTLQEECAWRLTALGLAWAPIPNGLYFPAHDEGERAMVGRLMRRLKEDGMINPGAADLIITGNLRALWVELKRPPARDLFGVRHKKGSLSDAQKAFRARCNEAGVPYVVATCWDEVRRAIDAHGLLERAAAA